ncbi:hypothetical protein Slin15195_G104520 [Septoria linicola]|uniref:Uncharacterized protein n=1 Tax=Septoria linicola TaxID=215465 RepID=A0A9Q9B434_9PEZI|nr:hypothetical protein Slin14017_G067560 [Septoria linicola]USW57133.1 hypothetical protein Slin15195_G104520 [Septoria linicola]
MATPSVVLGLCQTFEFTFLNSVSITDNHSQQSPARVPAAQPFAAEKSVFEVENEQSETLVQDLVTKSHITGIQITSQKPVTFFTLPRELRDIVYEHATLNVEARPGRKRIAIRKRNLPAEQTKIKIINGFNSGLLLASKQVRAEALIPYLNNTLFTLSTAEHVLSWARSMPTALRPALGEIQLELVSEVGAGKFDVGLPGAADREYRVRWWNKQFRREARNLVTRLAGESGSDGVRIMRQVFEVADHSAEWRNEWLRMRWQRHEMAEA